MESLLSTWPRVAREGTKLQSSLLDACGRRLLFILILGWLDFATRIHSPGTPAICLKSADTRGSFVTLVLTNIYMLVAMFHHAFPWKHRTIITEAWFINFCSVCAIVFRLRSNSLTFEKRSKATCFAMGLPRVRTIEYDMRGGFGGLSLPKLKYETLQVNSFCVQAPLRKSKVSLLKTSWRRFRMLASRSKRFLIGSKLSGNASDQIYWLIFNGDCLPKRAMRRIRRLLIFPLDNSWHLGYCAFQWSIQIL